MKFLGIFPGERRIATITADSLHDALPKVALQPTRVDHGMLVRGLSIVVYEFSLFVPPSEQAWFALGPGLYGGNALIYAFDESGETIDYDPERIVDIAKLVRWLDADAIEREISAERINRPEIKLNGTLVWSWPDAPPSDMAEALAKHRAEDQGIVP